MAYSFKFWVRIVLVAFCALIIPYSFVFATSPVRVSIPTSDSTIRLGMSAALSGPSADLGQSLYEGANAYFRFVNDHGGVFGRSIQLIVRDDQYDPEQTVRHLELFVNHLKVDALFGFVGTPTVTRILPLLKYYSDRHYYLFFPFSGAQPQREEPYKYWVFNLRASYRDEAEALVEALVSLGNKRIAVFYQSDAFGRGGWKGIKDALASRSLTIVSEATYRRGGQFSDSYTAAVAHIQNSRPEVIICVANYEASAGFIRDARDAGLKIPIANLSFASSHSVMDLLTTLPKGSAQYLSRLIFTNVVPHFTNSHFSAVSEFRTVMATYYPNRELNAVAFEGFLDAKLFVMFLKQAGPHFRREDIVTVMTSVKDWDIGMGVPISFSKTKRQGSNAVYFSTISGNSIVDLTDWNTFRQ